ncbi:Protein SYM1 [Smittium culicis]|uniref:Protein SYM1 n=1 Tax=Smittium culicis TaxID=133412 RepID=A0A1R1XK48_9FUNG|nr:Protein SYM1 [Smittium culicis]
MNFGKLWNQSAKRFPLLTLSVTNGALAAAGDVIAQRFTGNDSDEIEGKNASHDFSQTARFFLYGFIFAPISYKWYSILSHRFPMKPVVGNMKRKLGMDEWKVVSKRVMSDQFLFAPLAVGMFIGTMGVLERKNLSQIKQNFKDRYIVNLAAGYFLWPAVQIVNFSIIPLIYRVPFTGLASLFWNAFLSFSNSKTSFKEAAKILE